MDSTEGQERREEEKRRLREGISDHYSSLFGAPNERSRFETTDSVFEVLTWDPNSTKEGVYVFGTIGASSHLGTESSACEFFLGLSEYPAEIDNSLAEVALDGNGTNLVPRSGDTITLSFELWRGTTARTFLFTGDGSEIVPSCAIDGVVVEFVQLVPLFQNELEFKVRYGEKRLWCEFERLKVSYWQTDRGPANFEL